MIARLGKVAKVLVVLTRRAGSIAATCLARID